MGMWRTGFDAPIRLFIGPCARAGAGWRFSRGRRSSRRRRGKASPCNLNDRFEEGGSDAYLIPVVELRVGDEPAVEIGAVGARQILHHDVMGSEDLEGGVLSGDEGIPQKNLSLFPSHRQDRKSVV